MTLGENIVRLRTQKNWSQGDLADALEISRQSVSKWETDASIPELDKLLKLSELFGVTLDELVRGEDVPKTEPVPASFTPQATPEREKRRTIAGTVLLCTGAVILVFCLLLAGDLLTGLLFASPFLICGIICFAVKQRTGLYCGWAVYLCVDFYLRFAIGVSWTTIFMTHLWTYEMNYMCLAIAWVQFFRYARDDRLHDALLPCAQAARNEKRGYVAYRRLARRARRATAFDELRHHAAHAAHLQQVLPIFLHQRSV